MEDIVEPIIVRNSGVVGQSVADIDSVRSLEDERLPVDDALHHVNGHRAR